MYCLSCNSYIIIPLPNCRHVDRRLIKLTICFVIPRYKRLFRVTPSTRAYCVLWVRGKRCQVLYIFFRFRTSSVDGPCLKMETGRDRIIFSYGAYLRVCVLQYTCTYRVMCCLFSSLSSYFSFTLSLQFIAVFCASLSPHWKLVARTSSANKIMLLTTQTSRETKISR